MKTSDKTLQALSLYVKRGGEFGDREYIRLHDLLVEIHRDTVKLEQRPEPPLEMLERWARGHKPK